jgi:hypothetical protein
MCCRRSKALEVRRGRINEASLRQQMIQLLLRLDRASTVAREQATKSVRRAASLKCRHAKGANIDHVVSSSFGIVADCYQQSCVVAVVMQSYTTEATAKPCDATVAGSGQV